MDFPISRCLLVRASTLPPVGIILRPGSLEIPFGKLNFRSMCGMFVYGCDLLALRELGLLSRIAGVEEVNQGGGRRRNLSISNSPSAVNSSIHRRGIRCIAEPSWKLLVMQLAVGGGNPGQTDSSHTELISRALGAVTILKLVARLPPYRFPI